MGWLVSYSSLPPLRAPHCSLRLVCTRYNLTKPYICIHIVWAVCVLRIHARTAESMLVSLCVFACRKGFSFDDYRKKKSSSDTNNQNEFTLKWSKTNWSGLGFFLLILSVVDFDTERAHSIWTSVTHPWACCGPWY